MLRRCVLGWWRILHKLLKWDGTLLDLWRHISGLWCRHLAIFGRGRRVLGRWRILRHRLKFHLTLLHALKKFVSPLVHERIVQSVAQLAPWFFRAEFCCMPSLEAMKT